MRRRCAIVFAALGPLWLASSPGCSGNARPLDDPGRHVRPRLTPTDHRGLFAGLTFSDGPSVTRACLRCHPQAARDFMRTSHWLWLGEPELVPGHQEPMRIGKRNLINNFCISTESNWKKCTMCHAGYGWKDASFDFEKEELVDCLVCHDRSGSYAKGDYGLPSEGVDLLAAARSVGRPGRDNCGVCHFAGGGGDAVKHGDLDGTLARPVERLDVHMGRRDFACTECHRAERHAIRGRMISVSTTQGNNVACTDCHAPEPHRSERLNAHVDAVACQTCHLPEVARVTPTKVAWDWSTAGRDVPGADPHHYLKIKGSFVYQRGLVPEYRWFNGRVGRYLKGDPVALDGVTPLNPPQGDIADPDARIWPFKVHRGKQPADLRYRTLLVPKTVPPDGYWVTFDWDRSLRLGSAASGIPYSGEFGFAETEMVWNLSHMIAPKDRALQCTDCHGEESRMNFAALGYPGDPADMGGRKTRRMLRPAAGDKGVLP
ncbi:MAG: tetrathionate reductase family octaheme c-type cytochrome [Myxococcales bacterium]|nr:tetrathionate reductase family octaheme c-type cytochrome [Myxococcales bacterium]